MVIDSRSPSRAIIILIVHVSVDVRRKRDIAAATVGNNLLSDFRNNEIL